MSTDLGIQRSFKKEQKYWAVGHTLQAHLNFTEKEGIYAWVSYYSDGKFSNLVLASAKSPSVTPAIIGYRNHASMRFKQFSIGYKKYLKGKVDAEETWNIYAYGGFGLMMGRIINIHNPYVDSSNYHLPVREGKANFKRLTLDLGLGWETPLGADIFFYAEGRAWIPTTDYPSKYIFINNNAPVTGMVNAGIRILFD